MAEPNESNRPAPLATSAFAVMMLLTLVALGVSAFLLVMSLQGGPVPGCGPDSGFACDEVLSSRWGKWFDVPVSGLAMLIYVLVFVDLLRARAADANVRRHAFGQMILAAVLILGAAAWFVGLQMREGQFCNWCMTAHGVGAVLALLLIATVVRRGAVDRPVRNVMIAVVGLAVLIGGQFVYQSETMATKQVSASAGDEIDTGPGPDRTISILGRAVRGLKTHDYPAIGSPDAERIIVYIFDYTCPHCRLQHQNLLDVLDRYDDVGLLLLPMPLDAECNKNVTNTEPRHEGACAIARVAMAVWQHDAQTFVEFDKWLADQDPPTPELARERAVELIGEDALKQAMAELDFQDRVDRHIKLYEIVSQFAGTRSIPQVVTGSTIIAGRPPTAEQLFEVLEDEAGFPPPGEAADDRRDSDDEADTPAPVADQSITIHES